MYLLKSWKWFGSACVVLLLFGCAPKEADVEELRRNARIVDGVASEAHLFESLDYDRDLKQLRTFSRLYVELEGEMDRLRETVELESRGYYTTSEHDQVVGLLYRYLVAREAIWDLIALHGLHANTGDDIQKSKSTIVALLAASLLRDASATMIVQFFSNEAVVEKLNEGYHDLGISKGTFQRIFMQLTSAESIAAVDEAYEMFVATRNEKGTAMYEVVESTEIWKTAASEVPAYYESSKRKIDTILRVSSIGMPETRNQIRHSNVVKSVGDRLDVLMEDLYATRGKISDTFTGIKIPMSDLTLFENDEIEELKSYLKPGDILLTYTEGYMSNVFLPGMFKHGITYVGSPLERKNIDLKSFDISHLPEIKQAAFRNAIQLKETKQGAEANLIEAVAEGVVFNSLAHVLKTHTNRLLVLRPQISEEELRDQLGRVFLLLGDDYDFNFDFTNGSRHCCTEVIYRSLHGKGTIDFELVSRMGLQTLSADDIIGDFMENPGESFSFVAFVEEESAASNRARLYAGESGFRFFKKRWDER